MKEGAKVEDIKWELPVLERRMINEQYVKHNAKYHCFIGDGIDAEFKGISKVAKSLCGRHLQYIDEFESIESGEVLQFPAIACKVCFEKWKKKFYIDEE